MTSNEQNLVTYRGNCHCGNFIFEARLPELKQAYECNCSICSKKGYLWQFPGPDDFKAVKGDQDVTLTTYQFGDMKYQHKFCPNCGTPVMAVREDAPPGRKIGVNVRVLQDVNRWSLAITPVSKAHLEPMYQVPVFNGVEPHANIDGGKVYHGSCHCGAVTVAVESRPLDDNYDGDRGIIEGNCSICSRCAYIWIYPKSNQVAVTGREHLGYYAFASTIWRKAFCRTCGVHIMNEINPKTEDELAALSEKAQEWRLRVLDLNPITLRCLNDVDWRQLKTERPDCAKAIPPEYISP